MPMMVLLNFSCNTPTGSQRSFFSLLPLVLILDLPGGSKCTQVCLFWLSVLQLWSCWILSIKTKIPTQTQTLIFFLPLLQLIHFRLSRNRSKVIFREAKFYFKSLTLSEGKHTLGTGIPRWNLNHVNLLPLSFLGKEFWTKVLSSYFLLSLDLSVQFMRKEIAQDSKFAAHQNHLQ